MAAATVKDCERPNYHLIFNLDGTFRGYEYAYDREGNWHPSKVYEHEGRDQNGYPTSKPA